MYKIGVTKGTVEKRRKVLSSSTSIPKPFKIEFVIDVHNPYDVESTIHEKLSKYRVHEGREFFNLTKAQLKSVMEVLEKDLELLSDI